MNKWTSGARFRDGGGEQLYQLNQVYGLLQPAYHDSKEFHHVNHIGREKYYACLGVHRDSSGPPPVHRPWIVSRQQNELLEIKSPPEFSLSPSGSFSHKNEMSGHRRVLHRKSKLKARTLFLSSSQYGSSSNKSCNSYYWPIFFLLSIKNRFCTVLDYNTYVFDDHSPDYSAKVENKSTWYQKNLSQMMINMFYRSDTICIKIQCNIQAGIWFKENPRDCLRLAREAPLVQVLPGVFGVTFVSEEEDFRQARALVKFLEGSSKPWLRDVCSSRRYWRDEDKHSESQAIAEYDAE